MIAWNYVSDENDRFCQARLREVLHDDGAFDFHFTERDHESEEWLADQLAIVERRRARAVAREHGSAAKRR